MIRQTLTISITILLALAVWQGLIVAFRIHPIILPSPAQVMRAAFNERTTLFWALFSTGLTASIGLLGSILIGSVVSILFSQSAFLRKALYPYVIFLQTVPIVAIAPLLITWSGYHRRTVVLVAMIVSLFPIISNVTTGLISVDQNLRDLFRLSNAGRFKTLIKLHIPFAVSHLILGARVSAGLAVIGTIIGEFFVGTTGTATKEFATTMASWRPLDMFDVAREIAWSFISNQHGRGIGGLGSIMTSWQNNARTDALIAAVLASTLLGIVMLGLVNLIAATLLRRWTANVGFESGA